MSTSKSIPFEREEALEAFDDFLYNCETMKSEAEDYLMTYEDEIDDIDVIDNQDIQFLKPHAYTNLRKVQAYLQQTKHSSLDESKKKRIQKAKHKQLIVEFNAVINNIHLIVYPPHVEDVENNYRKNFAELFSYVKDEMKYFGLNAYLWDFDVYWEDKLWETEDYEAGRNYYVEQK